MNRGDFFREEATGKALEDKLRAALEESDSSTYEAKHDFAKEIWESEKGRSETLRAKGEGILPVPILVLSTLLGGGLVVLSNDWIQTPVAHAILVGTVAFVLLSGLSALYFGYRILDVGFGQAINPGIALEVHENQEKWHQAAAAHYLANYKRDLGRVAQLAFHARLAKEWTLAMVAGGLMGSLCIGLAVAIEGEHTPNAFDVLGVAASLLLWIAAFARLVLFPKKHR